MESDGRAQFTLLFHHLFKRHCYKCGNDKDKPTHKTGVCTFCPIPSSAVVVSTTLHTTWKYYYLLGITNDVYVSDTLQWNRYLHNKDIMYSAGSPWYIRCIYIYMLFKFCHPRVLIYEAYTWCEIMWACIHLAYSSNGASIHMYVRLLSCDVIFCRTYDIMLLSCVKWSAVV